MYLCIFGISITPLKFGQPQEMISNLILALAREPNGFRVWITGYVRRTQCTIFTEHGGVHKDRRQFSNFRKIEVLPTHPRWSVTRSDAT